MRKKIIGGGGIIIHSALQVAADSAEWDANAVTHFPKSSAHHG